MKRAVLADVGPLYAAAMAAMRTTSKRCQQLQKLARDRREVIVAYPTLLEAYSLVLFRYGHECRLQVAHLYGGSLAGKSNTRRLPRGGGASAGDDGPADYLI